MLGGGGGSGLLGGGISLDKNRRDAEITGGFDVGERVADHDGAGTRDVGEVAEGLFEEAGFRLAAIAGVSVVRAVVERVDAGLVLGEVLLQASVQGVDIGCRVMAQGDATLVGDDEDANAGAIERGDGAFDAGQEMKIAPSADVSAFGRLAVDDAVAVEEDTADIGEGRCHLENWLVAVAGD